MDQVKEAFNKVKEEMNFLKDSMKNIQQELEEIQLSILELRKIKTSTQEPQNKTLRHINKTEIKTSTDTSTHNLPFKTLKQVNIDSSIGNEGVSTDRQTDTSTDTSTHNSHLKQENKHPDPSIILGQLDSLKKDIRLKIKRLTNQELLVFSAIYQLENEQKTVDYSLISRNLNLSESSIRDYVQRMINKGMPIIKEKINNKRIVLRISEDLKKLASLNTLLELREL